MKSESLVRDQCFRTLLRKLDFILNAIVILCAILAGQGTESGLSLKDLSGFSGKWIGRGQI